VCTNVSKEGEYIRWILPIPRERWYLHFPLQKITSWKTTIPLKTCRLFRLNVRVYYSTGEPYTHFYSSLLPLPSSEPCEQFLYSRSYLRNICRSWRSQFNSGILHKKIILWSSGVNNTCNNTMIIYLQSFNIKFLGNRFREANVYLILVFRKSVGQ